MKISLFFAFLALISPYASKQMETSYNNFMKDCYNYVINCQKEEESSEEILEESSKEEEIVYEPSPEEIALSLPQDDYALYIPAINCSIKVHSCDNEKELDLPIAQSYMDKYHMGVDLRYDIAYGEGGTEAYGKRSFIADHSDQSFYGLWNLNIGAKAYIAKGSTVKKYALTATYHAYMQYVEYEHIIAEVPTYQGKNLMLGDADIVLMTCAEDWTAGGRYITYWKEI